MKTVFTTVANHAEKIEYKNVTCDSESIHYVEEELNSKGFYKLEVVGEKPELDTIEELVYQMTKIDNTITKTYSKKLIAEDLPEDIPFPRKFSKLKLYGVCMQMGLWQKLVEWMSNTYTEQGLNLKDAFDYAQEISEEHPLFENYFLQAKQACEISDEVGEIILSSSVLN